jgi:hypothetical protein
MPSPKKHAAYKVSSSGVKSIVLYSVVLFKQDRPQKRDLINVFFPPGPNNKAGIHQADSSTGGYHTKIDSTVREDERPEGKYC